MKFGAPEKLTLIFHAPEVFICKAFKDAAVVFYCKSLITQQMGTSGSACKVKSFQLLSISDWGTVCYLRFLTIYYSKHMESFIFNYR